MVLSQPAEYYAVPFAVVFPSFHNENRQDPSPLDKLLSTHFAGRSLTFYWSSFSQWHENEGLHNGSQVGRRRSALKAGCARVALYSLLCTAGH